MRFLLLVVLVAGCSGPEPVPAQAPAAQPSTIAAIQTDRTSYAMSEGPFGPETTIVATFTAPADRAAYLVNCNGAISTGLQQRTGAAWVYVWAAEMNACLSPAIVIPPGGSRTERMVVASGAHAAVDSRRNGTRIDGGTYRVVWHGVLASFDPQTPPPFGEELPLEQRTSAPFTIEPPAPHDPARSSPAAPPAEIAVAEPSHGAVVDAGATLHIRLELPPDAPLAGSPHLYVDRQWIDEAFESPGARTRAIEWRPAGGWLPGRHEARVAWQDQQARTGWYAWSFTVKP